MTSTATPGDSQWYKLIENPDETAMIAARHALFNKISKSPAPADSPILPEALRIK
jgi:hypothetical protein